eukprot:scaffold113807_cov15-Tisochrysis_lutea.AAC.2
MMLVPQDEIIRYQERTGTHRLLRLDSFADHTTKFALPSDFRAFCTGLQTSTSSQLNRFYEWSQDWAVHHECT